MQVALRSAEVELMANVAAGDPRARRVLLEQFIRRIRRIAASILVVEADVEDAVQAIAMEVLASASGFRGENLPAWIDRIAVRTAMRGARERQLRFIRNAGEEVLLSLAADHHDESLEDSLPRPLSHYLDQLPPEQRTTLVLRHAKDLSIPEIASTMSVSPNTVKYRLFVAREQVRKSIRRDLAVGTYRGALPSS